MAQVTRLLARLLPSLLVLHGAAAFSCAVGNNATTCAALGDLWSSTGGPGWQNTTGWAAAAAGALGEGFLASTFHFPRRE